MEGIRWKDLSPGRCEHLQVPSGQDGFVSSVTVLDAPSHLLCSSPFAALLVPAGQEQDWMFSTANGLWELLFSSSVSRLVVLRRPNHRLPACEEPNNFTDADYNDDGSLKQQFLPLLSSLFPWSHCHLGPTPDPYVVYEDNVVERMVVEIRHSEALGSDILVEDVELACSSSRAAEVSGQEPKNRRLRRRMRFQQMPNLIQTEVLATICKDGHLAPKCGVRDIKLWNQNRRVEESAESPDSLQNHEVVRSTLTVHPDHSELVQVYFPPIVAGLVLASPCLQFCIESKVRPRVLTIGLGGGALPVFLHKQFGFSVLAIDNDETVVELARRYFGFVENEHLQVQVKDGIEVVYGMACQAHANGLVSTDVLKEWQEISEGFDLETSAIFISDDIRMHVIVVDVCISEPCSRLLSPPSSFLTRKFLLSVLLSLHEGGVLVINVIPRSPNDLLSVEKSLRKVFSGIYGIQIDENYVLFAFRSKIGDIDMSCSFARLVACAVGEQYFDQIDEINFV